MLRILKQASQGVNWPVLVRIAEDDGGVTEHEFTARLRPLTISELVKAQTLPSANQQVGEVVRAHLLDWSGVEDEKGKAVPFAPKNVAALLDVIVIRDALVRALIDVSLARAPKRAAKAEGK